MTKVTHNLGIKVTCIFLVMITGITAFFSIVGILFAGESGIFSDQKKSYYDTPWCENTTYSYSDNVVRWYIDGAEPEEIASIFSNGKTNFAFELYDYNGNLIITSEMPEKIGLTTMTREISTANILILTIPLPIQWLAMWQTRSPRRITTGSPIGSII